MPHTLSLPTRTSSLSLSSGSENLSKKSQEQILVWLGEGKICGIRTI